MSIIFKPLKWENRINKFQVNQKNTYKKYQYKQSIGESFQIYNVPDKMVGKNPNTLVKKVNVKCLNIFKILDCQFTLKNNKAISSI